MSKLPIAIITNCSATRTVKPNIRGIDLPKDLTMQEAMDHWIKALNTEKPSMTPAELYRGIGFNTIVKLQEYIKTENINIVSAGQGLMRLNEKIVPYDFTTDPKHEDSIHKIVTQEPFVMPVWWRMINNRLRTSENPIARIINDPDIKLVLAGCNSRFLKLLPDDILSADPDNLIRKLRIITTSKSTSSIPQQLRQLIITYDRRLLASTMGNRNDRNHRALHHFVNLIKDPSNMTLSAHEHQELVDAHTDFSEQVNIAPNIEELLDRHSKMLEDLSPDAAYLKLTKMYGSFGGITKFRAAWRMRVHTKTPPKVEINQDAALTALQGIQGSLLSGKGRSASWEDESEVLEILRQFSTLIKEHTPDARFNGGDICNWAKSYFEQIDKPIPTYLQSPIKLSHILVTYAGDLGFEAVYSSGGTGGRTYVIK